MRQPYDQDQRFQLFPTHIYKEGNQCAKKLTNLTYLVSNFTWWSDIHADVTLNFNRNKLRIFNFRIR